MKQNKALSDCESAVIQAVKEFYRNNPHIHESHGVNHALVVYNHAKCAISCCRPKLSPTTQLEILVASLLHDADDSKYFPHNDEKAFVNAKQIMQNAKVPQESIPEILFMIDAVSCSKNGNSIPQRILDNEHLYYLLIPRWSDRIESVGAKGVVRCYQYSLEKQLPLSSTSSPRPRSLEEVWNYASPKRFEAYQASGGGSKDMISHYYDKLLHVACPSPAIVQNQYLESKLQDSAKELIEVCLRYGRSGVVDESYIQQLDGDEIGQ